MPYSPHASYPSRAWNKQYIPSVATRTRFCFRGEKNTVGDVARRLLVPLRAPVRFQSTPAMVVSVYVFFPRRRLAWGGLNFFFFPWGLGFYREKMKGRIFGTNEKNKQTEKERDTIKKLDYFRKKNEEVSREKWQEWPWGTKKVKNFFFCKNTWIVRSILNDLRNPAISKRFFG